MSCPHCGANVAPGSRFCTECGRPLAAAGQAPAPNMPPAPPNNMGMRPPMPPGPMSQMVPPAPPQMPPQTPPQMPPQMRPPVAPPPAPPAFVPPAPPPQPMTPPPQTPMPQPAPQPMTPPAPPAPVTQVAAATVAPVAPPTNQPIRLATSGDLYNDGSSVAVLVTDNQLILLPVGGTPRVEEIPGIRQAVVGDFDGDLTQELAVFTDSHVWVIRFSAVGAVHGGKAPLQEAPGNLFRSPLTDSEGRTVLMSITPEKIGFYRLHPARGLVEVGSSTLPDVK